MHGAVDVILRVMALLVVVSALIPLADRLRMPHAVLLAGVGITLGIGMMVFSSNTELGWASGVVYDVSDLGLDPQTFLLLFLPPLLFTAGLTIDVRRLIDEVWAILLLAIVAVVVCTAVVGVMVDAVSSAGLIGAMLLGAIVATTDPAAVVAIFRDLGAPRRLTILVQGESLFNDAAAIAIFAILLEILRGAREPDLSTAMLAFGEHFLGGAIFGHIIGRAACWLMGRLNNSAVGEATVSVALAYLSYIVGEEFLHISGVVAVVTSALTVAALGPVRLQPPNWHHLLESWHTLEFWSNSMIFLLASVLAGQLMSTALMKELWIVPVVVAGTLIARAIVLFGLLPGLAKIRAVEPVSNGYKAVILWGGLRGAVTMVLALSVARNESLPEAVRHFVAVVAIGFVLFTLMVSAPTLRPLLRLLGLNRLSPVETALRNRVIGLSHAKLRDQIADLAQDYGMDRSLASRVCAVTPAPVVSVDEMSDEELTAEDRLRVGLLTCVTHEKDLYLRHFEDQTIPRHLVAPLTVRTDRMMDRIKTDGASGFERATREAVTLPWRLRFAAWLHRTTGLSSPLEQALEDRFEALLVARIVLRDVGAFNRLSVRPILGRQTSERIAHLLQTRGEAIQRAIAAMELQYPTYAETLATQQLGRATLRLEAADYSQKFHDSLISREVYNDLMGEIAVRRLTFERRQPLDLGLKLTAMIGRVPIFAALDDHGRTEIARMLRPRLAMPGEKVIAKGERATAMFFIAAGAVEVQVAQPPIRLTDGDFFGEMALIRRMRRTATVSAAGYCQLLVLDRRALNRVLRNYPDVAAAIHAAAAERLAANTAAQARAESPGE